MAFEPHAPGKSGKGQSAMEVILALPFLLLVMTIGINFGKGFLLQQRAVAAARYAAWHEARARRPISENAMDQAGYGGNSLQVSSTGGGQGWNRFSAVVSGLLEPIYGSLERKSEIECTVSYRWR
jgi:hypothetical protein